MLDPITFAVALVNAAPDAVFVTDEQGGIVFANDEAERMFGYERATLLGSSVDMLLAEAVRGRHANHRRGYTAAPTRRAMGTFELPACRADGSQLWVAVSLSPLEIEGTVYVVAIARDVSDNREMQERLRYLGTHDALTGLYNRGYFDEELARLERGRVFPVALIVADIDGLKRVNDTFGHAAGDRLLVQAAGVLRAAFRAEDCVARLGGDEFAVVLPGVLATELVAAIARIRDGASVGVSLSIGSDIADDGPAILRALQVADRRMYDDKARHRAAPSPGR